MTGHVFHRNHVPCRVHWQFNRRFRITRKFPTLEAAKEYATYVYRLWHIRGRIERLK